MSARATGFELLTPRGPGGVAVVAVHGPERWQLVAPFVDVVPPLRRPRLSVLTIEGRATDEVLLVDRPEHARLELHLHGAPVVVRALEAAVGGFVTTPPRRGDSLLRRARGRAQLALALEQQGLDFAGFLAAAATAELDAARARSRVALALTTPRRLVLCGDQNAGKSTLMNRLLFDERVLTGDLPGLTRDPVCEGVLLDGYPYEVVDTAGEGPVADELDRRALDRARLAREDGLLLLCVDGTRPPSPCDLQIRADHHTHTLVVRTKADQPGVVWPESFTADVTTACLAPDAAPRVRLELGATLRRFRELPPAGAVGGVAALDAGELERLETVRGTVESSE